MPRLDKYLPGNEDMLEEEQNEAADRMTQGWNGPGADYSPSRFAALDAVKISAMPLEPREGWCLSGPLHGKKLEAKSDSVHLATEVGGKIEVFEYQFVQVHGTGLWVPSEWDDEKWAAALINQAFVL